MVALRTPVHVGLATKSVSSVVLHLRTKLVTTRSPFEHLEAIVLAPKAMQILVHVSNEYSKWIGFHMESHGAMNASVHDISQVTPLDEGYGS
ncbi:hypothetical protein VNO77_31213 [Canavalia gladiata]|uniref:Uncharacterized protein n=1 Tax=Canavalia gladiata TaxID=3824 RepID=A0AAN9KNS7_CANGL